MKAIHKAILKTLTYADIFDYPLTKEEIYQWLIHPQPITLATLGSELQALAYPERSRGTSSEPLIQQSKKFFYLSDRQSIVTTRLKRKLASLPKLAKAKKISNFLKLIPSINLIAVTGALAMNNSDESDDIDLMIITKSNRLWLTRLLVIIILELFHLRRHPQKQKSSVPERNVDNFKDKFCLNLFLDESSLTIPVSRRNLYTAHEVAQVKPIHDKNQTYQKFISANLWVKKFLPHSLKLENSTTPTSTTKSNPFILETIAYKLQHWYMAKKLTREKVSLHSAFFHPRPTGKIVLTKYQKGLKLADRAGPCQQKSVLVTGVFDVLHSEHKTFLQQAKKQGDILLVGLETDARVKKLKGPDRPINPLQTRINNLKSWGIADKIFALPKKFDSEKDHRALIQKIKPDILAVSSHTPNLPAKRRLLNSIGASLKVVHSHNPKISVTKMLKQNI